MYALAFFQQTLGLHSHSFLSQVRFVDLQVRRTGEYGHLHVSCKKSSVDPNNAASAKCYDLINVLDQVVEHMLDALIVCPSRAKLPLVMVIPTIVLSGAGEFLPNFGLSP